MMRGRLPQTEAEQRRELGGYSDAEFSAEFARSHRSDVAAVAQRLVGLLVVYGLLAHAVATHDLPAWVPTLPLAFEFVLVMWVGQVLARWVIDCPRFRKSAGRLWLTLFWTLIVAAVYTGLAGYELLHAPVSPGGGSITPRSMLSALHLEGVQYVLLGIVATLIAATWPEVARWKRERGVFVWATIMTMGFRLGVMILMGIVLAILAGVTEGFVVELALGLLSALPGRPATWGVFLFLLAADLLTLVISTLMHREAAGANAVAPGTPGRGVRP